MTRRTAPGRRVDPVTAAAEWPHGTRGHYVNAKCRCEYCRLAQAIYGRVYYWRTRKPGPGRGYRSDLHQ